MPYCSGAVATVPTGPVSYRTPPRLSTYRSLSSSLERSSWSSSLSSRPSYTSEYKAKFTASRTSSVPTYSRTSSLSDDSGFSSRYSSTSRERSETREPSSGSSSYTRSRDASKTRTSSDSSTLGRRYGSSLSSLTSAADLYNKYSPSNYLADTRPPRPSLSSSSSAVESDSRSTRAAPSTSPDKATSVTVTLSRLSTRAGGSSPSAGTTTERRLRAGPTTSSSATSASEVIIHFKHSDSGVRNNNNVADNSSDDDDDEDDDVEEEEEENDNDGNGNKRRPSVAEIRKRFDGSLSVSAPSASSHAASTAALPQNTDGVRRRRLPITSPSPMVARKVMVASGDPESSDDEKAPTHIGSDTDEETQCSRPPASPKFQFTYQSSTSNSDADNALLGSSPRLGRQGRRSSVEQGGLVGLRNIGNTCFMNSVLQCLSNTRPLLEYMLSDSYLSDINTSTSGMKGALIKAFSTVIRELWRSEDERVVNTTALKSQIQRFAPRFMGYSQQDAQEFLRYLLEGLHEDVNRVATRPKPLLTDIDDTLSDQQKANEAWRRYLRVDDSKVVDIFVGQLKSTLRCTTCGHCSVTFDPFWDLSLPIPSRTGQLRLQQCLDHFTREEVLDGDEKPTCAKCQMRRKCTKSFTIQKFPRILVLHLKRFSPMERFRGKLNVTVEFPLTGLDLSSCAASRGQGCSYSLYGVANHSGTTYSGHYTAYCRHPYTGDWHEYNDSRVSNVSTRSIVSSEAYVLFYELSSHSSHL